MPITGYSFSCESPRMALLGILVGTGLAYAAPATGCVQSLCVNRIDDSVAAPVSGMLRYAVLNAPAGATITFDPALNGQTITLDGSSPNNHIKISQDVTIQGPGANLLTISGGGKTRIFFIAGGMVMILGVKLANGFAKGGNGAGGGGGAAGMGGAVFLNGGNVTLNGVMFSGNRAQGGLGASGSFGGGGGFGGNGGPGLSEGGGSGGTGGDLTGGEGGQGGYLLFGGSPGFAGGFSGGGGASGAFVKGSSGGQGGFGGGGGGGSPGGSGGQRTEPLRQGDRA